MPVVCISIQ